MQIADPNWSTEKKQDWQWKGDAQKWLQWENGLAETGLETRHWPVSRSLSSRRRLCSSRSSTARPGDATPVRPDRRREAAGAGAPCTDDATGLPVPAVDTDDAAPCMARHHATPTTSSTADDNQN